MERQTFSGFLKRWPIAGVCRRTVVCVYGRILPPSAKTWKHHENKFRKDLLFSSEINGNGEWRDKVGSATTAFAHGDVPAPGAPAHTGVHHVSAPPHRRDPRAASLSVGRFCSNAVLQRTG